MPTNNHKQRERRRQKQRDYHKFLKNIKMPATLDLLKVGIFLSMMAFHSHPGPMPPVHAHSPQKYITRSSLGNLVDTQCCPALISNSCSLPSNSFWQCTDCSPAPYNEKNKPGPSHKTASKNLKKIQDVPCPEQVAQVPYTDLQTHEPWVPFSIVLILRGMCPEPLLTAVQIARQCHMPAIPELGRLRWEDLRVWG